jgi:hypothetical protein
MADVYASPMVAHPLRLLQICATSDGGAALVISSVEYAKRMGRGDAPRVAAISTVTPTFASADVEMPDIATDSAAAAGIEATRFRAALAPKAYEEAGIGPEDVSLAEVYDLSSALELTRDNRASAADMLGLSRQGLYAKLRRYGLGDLDNEENEAEGQEDGLPLGRIPYRSSHEEGGVGRWNVHQVWPNHHRGPGVLLGRFPRRGHG